MNKKVEGFTLAEVMVSLGIVAVAAALTLPNLFLGLKKNIMSSSLSRAVEQVEYAAQNIFHAVNEYNEDHDIVSNADVLYPITLEEIVSNPAANANSSIFSESAYDETVQAYFGCYKISNDPRSRAQDYKDFDGGAVGGDDASDVLAFVEHGNVYRFSKSNIELVAASMEPANQDSPDAFVLFLGVDTNGYSEGPNRYGKDLFAFKLRNDGRVIPFGDADNCVKDDVKDGISCSARIIMDSFKVEYD